MYEFNFETTCGYSLDTVMELVILNSFQDLMCFSAYKGFTLFLLVILGKILSSALGKDSALSARPQRSAVTSFAHLLPSTLFTKFALRTKVHSF